MSGQQVSDRGTRNVTAHNGDIRRHRPRADFRRGAVCLGSGFGTVPCLQQAFAHRSIIAIVQLSPSRCNWGQSRRQGGSDDGAGGRARSHANGFAEAEWLFGNHLPGSCPRCRQHSHRVVAGQARRAQAGGGMRAHGQRVDRSCQTTSTGPLRHLTGASDKLFGRRFV